MAGRRRTIILVASIAAVAALGVGIWRYGPVLAVDLAADALTRRGLGPVTVADRHFADGALVLQDVMLGQPADGTSPASGARARRVTLAFTLDALLDGRLADLRVENLTLRLVDGQAGPFAPLLEPASGTDETPPAPLTLPIDMAAIDGIDAAWLAADGTPLLRFQGSASADRLSSDPDLTLTGRIAWSAADGATDAAADLALSAGLSRDDGRERIELSGDVVPAGGGPGWHVDRDRPLPVSFTLTRSLVDGGVRIDLADCLDLPTLTLDEGEAALRLTGGRLCPVEGQPLLDLTEGARSVQGVLAEARVDGDEVTGRLPTITLAGDPLHGPLQMTASGGDLRLPGAGLTVSELTIEAGIETPDAPEPVLTIGRLSARLTDIASPLRFAPLDIALSGRAADQGIELAGQMRDPRQRVRADITLSHDPVTGRGSAAVRVPAVTWARERLQPADLIPAAGGIVTGVAGQTAATATIRWGGGPLRLRLVASLADTGFTAEAATVSGLTGQLVLTGPDPWVTDGPQTLDIGRIEAGLPLTDGRMTAILTPTTFDIVNAEWPFAGGRLSVEPVRVPLGAGDRRVILRAENLELGLLAAFAEQPALNADGRISGFVPVVLGDEGIRIDHAEFTGLAGRLSWASDTAEAAAGGAGEGADLLARALEDFRMRHLRLTLDGPLEGELTAGLSLAGSSPAVYDGYPMEINLDVRGPLAQLLSVEGRLFDSGAEGFGQSLVKDRSLMKSRSSE
ncbi:YdbH domain-containing protein [Tistrella mobilis]|uniref:intermembrane phospholipid transport protein YdbH family protein n=1 Tax=Tistrella mobilis TaxID=171437 RepID=UPI003559208C